MRKGKNININRRLEDVDSNLHGWLSEVQNFNRGNNWRCGESEVTQSFLTLCDPWTVAHQAPPSMGFSRQEYWSGFPFPSPGDLLDPGIEPRSPTLQPDTLTSEPPGKLWGWEGTPCNWVDCVGDRDKLEWWARSWEQLGPKAEAGSQLWKEILGRVEGAILCALRGQNGARLWGWQFGSNAEGISDHRNRLE